MKTRTKENWKKGLKLAGSAVALVGLLNAPYLLEMTGGDRAVRNMFSISPLIEKIGPIKEYVADFINHFPERVGFVSSNVFARMKQYEPYVAEAANKHLNGNANLIYAMMLTESEMNPNCRSKKGATGLMQLMPCSELKGKNLYDPRTNIDLGAREIADYLGKYRMEIALAAYNSGPNRESIKAGRIPQILETQIYVPRVMAYLYCFDNIMWPLQNPEEINSGYGLRVHPIYHVRKMHRGIDIDAKQGDTVLAAIDGKVIEAGWKSKNGYYVAIEKTFKFDGSRTIIIRTYYLHLSKISVRTQRNVKIGDPIGEVGSTGASTGDHLHFQVDVVTPLIREAIDPLVFLWKKGKFSITDDGKVVKAKDKKDKDKKALSKMVPFTKPAEGGREGSDAQIKRTSKASFFFRHSSMGYRRYSG